MRYALVTGGSRGIGRNICYKLAQMGFTVIINYVSNETEAQKTLEEVKNLRTNLTIDIEKMRRCFDCRLCLPHRRALQIEKYDSE